MDMDAQALKSENDCNKSDPSEISKTNNRYAIGSPPQGKILIINQCDFDSKSLQPRTGSDVDANALKNAFLELGFKEDQIQLLKNKKEQEIKTALKSVATEDHSHSDIFICVILTHGDKEKHKKDGWMMRIHGTDFAFPVAHLWESFDEDKCPGLKEKPKIFIIQACRGHEVDNGIKIFKENSQQENEKVKLKRLSREDSENCNLHTEPDILVAYSTVDDEKWRLLAYTYQARMPLNVKIQALRWPFHNSDIMVAKLFEANFVHELKHFHVEKSKTVHPVFPQLKGGCCLKPAGILRSLVGTCRIFKISDAPLKPEQAKTL